MTTASFFTKSFGKLKSLFILTVALIFAQNGFCQNTIDFKEIQTLTKDSTSRYFYDTLVHDFLTVPQTFEETKGLNVYYGKLYSKYYKVYDVNGEEHKFSQLIQKGNCKKAITVGDQILKGDPVNLEILLKMFSCYNQLGSTELAKITREKVSVLYRAILHSGTGERKESAYNVVSIADEYAVMAMLGMQPLTRRSSMHGESTTDSWEVRDLKSREKKQLHFNVLINLSAMPEFNK